ncbi:hypothetical protein ACSQ67_001264 [Phaseolus vulgaris]
MQCSFTLNDSNPNPPSHLLYLNRSSSSEITLYPYIDYNDLIQNIFLEDSSVDSFDRSSSSGSPERSSTSSIMIIMSSLHAVTSVVIRLRQGDNTFIMYARMADEIKWLLTKDETTVKVDDSHYFLFQLLEDSLRLVSSFHGATNEVLKERKKLAMIAKSLVC